MEQENGQMGRELGEVGRDAGRMAKAALQMGKGGQTAAGMAAGAAGGPLGAALLAAWSGRHTLFKVLAFLCLSLLFLIVLVAALPSILMNRLFGLDGTKPEEGETPFTVYAEMSGAVAGVVEDGHGKALEEVERIISDGGYDRDRSMAALTDYAQGSSGYDVSYILAAYSVSVSQAGARQADLVSKLEGVSGKMFPVTSEEKLEEREVPARYTVYEPVTLTVVTKEELAGTVDGIPRYRYETEERTYYQAGGTRTSTGTVEVDAYGSVDVTVPVYSDGRIMGTETKTYYEPRGKETLAPGTETVRFAACTIHPFDNAVIAEAFGIDPDAAYGETGITYAEAIDDMALSLKKTLYGSAAGGQVPLTDVELIAFANRQECSDTRRHVLTTALSLVGKVPYFWGGQAAESGK